jgi:putative flippase GtrA
VIDRPRDNLISTFRVSDESKLDPRLRNAKGVWRTTAVRWLTFNAVGALGIAVQLAVLLGLKTGLHLSYLLATALAVEAAVVHNFLWHERHTWADRVQPSWRRSLPRLLRFNLTTGGVSIAGNLALMKVMVGWGHLNYLVANGLAIAVCSVVNFLLSDRIVFGFDAARPRHYLL